MKKYKLTTVAALLSIVGFIYTDGSSVTVNTDYRGYLQQYLCKLKVETVDVDVPLNPSVCGQSSVTVTSIKRGFCINNGDNCVSMHYRHAEVLLEQCCIASTASTVEGTVPVSSGGCSQTVTYTFTNATDCKCQYIQLSTRT